MAAPLFDLGDDFGNAALGEAAVFGDVDLAAAADFYGGVDFLVSAGGGAGAAEFGARDHAGGLSGLSLVICHWSFVICHLLRDG
jgi:hypothetical protein